MRLKSLRTSNIAELNERACTYVAACGYEHRSIEVSRLVTGPEHRTVILFDEWPDVLARPRNEKEFAKSRFTPISSSGGDSRQIQRIVENEANRAAQHSRSAAFDISSMTRVWHGGIIRQLRTMEIDKGLETFFAYVPAKFSPPSHRVPPNEFVAPVAGFASLAAPDLPIAAVIGLGYEPERALGLQQYLDPQLTLLMTPKSGESDPYYAALRHNNRGLLSRTDSRWIFEYDLSEPGGTFSTLASVVGGLRESYRVVLVSLGPKIFGLLSFLLATKFQDVSVWRVSAGMHGHPRDAFADLDRVVVASAIWEPATELGAGLR